MRVCIEILKADDIFSGHKTQKYTLQKCDFLIIKQEAETKMDRQNLRADKIQMKLAMDKIVPANGRKRNTMSKQ
jgi:hypothetical protein